LVRLQDATKFKFPVCPSDSVGIDGEIDSKLANRG